RRQPARVEGVLTAKDVDRFDVRSKPREVLQTKTRPPLGTRQAFEPSRRRQQHHPRRRTAHLLQQAAIDIVHLRQVLPRADQRKRAWFGNVAWLSAHLAPVVPEVTVHQLTRSGTIGG